MALEILQKEEIPFRKSSPPSQEDRHIKWSSVFCGSFATSSFCLLAMTFGACIGLTSIIAINPMIPEFFSGPISADGSNFWTWIYTLVTFLISFFIGGYVASRSAKVQEARDGVLYGITSWSVLITLTTLLISFLSPYMEQLFAGTISSSSNWLVFCIFALGAMFSALGGNLGKTPQNHGLSLAEATTENFKSAS